MTELEAVYWKRYIDKVLSEKLDGLSVSEHDALRISEFAERYMTLVTGQQMLPQAIFRQFLELFSHIPEIQEDIRKAQEEVAQMLLRLPEECTVEEIYEMFDMFVAPFYLDKDGYIVISRLVTKDKDGYLVLPNPVVDLEGWIRVYNQLNY